VAPTPPPSFREDDVRAVDFVGQPRASDHLFEGFGHRPVPNLDAYRPVGVEILVVDEQVTGLFFDFVHHLFHFHLPHADRHACGLGRGVRGRQA